MHIIEWFCEEKNCSMGVLGWGYTIKIWDKGGLRATGNIKLSWIHIWFEGVVCWVEIKQGFVLRVADVIEDDLIIHLIKELMIQLQIFTNNKWLFTKK